MGFLPFVFPLAELEVGQHLYWQIGNFRIHGQVFMTSWLLIGALLALVVIGTKKIFIGKLIYFVDNLEILNQSFDLRK